MNINIFEIIGIISVIVAILCIIVFVINKYLINKKIISNEYSQPKNSISIASTISNEYSQPKIGLLIDEGDIFYKGWNQSAWVGLQTISKKYSIPENNITYTNDINSIINQNYNLIIGVGFLLGDVIAKAALENPLIKFAIVDFISSDNVKSIIYNIKEASMQAGYLAAGYSKTGIVATFGGMNIPQIIKFMDGFAQGVEYYSEINNKNVTLLGWNRQNKQGTFVGDFYNNQKKEQIAKNFEKQNADVIFPIVGDITSVLQQSFKSKKSVVIGVDNDISLKIPKYESVILTSVIKNISISVQSVTEEFINNKFTYDDYIGTLENKGVNLAPYYNFDSKIDSRLKDDVDKLGDDIKLGIVLLE